ncbi:hypothetical protein [Marinobacter profundi]|nr:hypothetical protein [Marinobacter profundi]
MATLSPEAKAKIDSLSRAELQNEVNLGNQSRFQREKFAYLKSRLDQIEQEELDSQKETENAHSQTKIQLAADANAISRTANRLSVLAVIVSLVSLLIAVVALYSE